MPSEKNFHMTPEEFRQRGHDMVDWLAEYFQRIESFPVLSRVEPGQIRASLPANPPPKGEPFEAMLKDVEKLILPGITHWQSPNFFAYFPCNNSGASILGDLLSSGLGVQGMLWATSPACTEVETHMLDWLVQMLDLPQKFLSSDTGGGVIQDTASSASLCALLTARERATNFVSNKHGCDGRLVAYTSTQAHSSIEKAVQIAGGIGGIGDDMAGALDRRAVPKLDQSLFRSGIDSKYKRNQIVDGDYQRAAQGQWSRVKRTVKNIQPVLLRTKTKFQLLRQRILWRLDWNSSEGPRGDVRNRVQWVFIGD